MATRTLRSAAPSRRAQRIDRYLLPAVTLLLVLGAVFVIVAWMQATDLVAVARKAEDQRAVRLAVTIDRLIERTSADLDTWAAEHESELKPGNEAALARELARRTAGSGSTETVAWLVVRTDGRVAAVGEREPGRLVANGVADDLRRLGRSVAARGERAVSDRLKFGDEYVYAVAVPIGGKQDAAASGALIRVAYVDRSAIGAVFDDRDRSSVDAATLVDGRARILDGAALDPSDDRVSRPVADTGWKVSFERTQQQLLLPEWMYPVFALLLLTVAGATVLGDVHRRRLTRLGAERARQVHALYELASHALHAETIDEQAAELARSALDLVDIEGARVTVPGVDGGLTHEQGTIRASASSFTTAIEGPRGSLGELVVVRTAQPLDEEEQWVVQTAATLVGAAMHTLASLETERAAAAELQRLDELRSNLLATVAHELLSPLTAVKGVLGLLSMQDDLGARGQEYVDVATERTDRLVELIRDLFDCSLLETGQLDIRPQRRDAEELLESALGAQAAARPGELRLSATPNLQITVDPVRFDQLVNNLVTNAFRHGEPPVEVAIRPGEGGVLIVVTDEGRGIPEAQRAEIFSKFWQGSSGHARIAQGAGLGLSLVQGLVELHGGEIAVDSTHADGRGARFTAFFPDEVPANVRVLGAHSDEVAPLV